MKSYPSVSTLFETNGVHLESAEQPEFFHDLNLDLIIDAIIKPKQEYNLKPFFYTPLQDPETVRYRQETMQDLETASVMEPIKAFAEGMATVRRYLAMVEKLDFPRYRQGWILEAALVYCQAVTMLSRNLTAASLHSRGMTKFREYLQEYVSTPSFQTLFQEAQQVKQALSELQYCVIIESGKFTVKRYEGEAEYSSEVQKTFEKFKQADAQDYMVQLPDRYGMSHIEAIILDFVARLFPEPFASLERFCTDHLSFTDATILTFDREIQFYIAYLDFIADLRRQGLPFCYPEVRTDSKEIFLYDGFDLALANARRQNPQPVVLNDFCLQGQERILVVTGPNQGGKTTFARMFGQIHYLASLGCPVPGRKARLYLFDRICVHFERTEDVRNLRGKLEDDLVRIHNLLSQATPRSLFVLNEIFSSTTVHDALFLSRQIMTQISELDALTVWVTFLDELASFNAKTVSMVALVDAENPARRTFKIVPKPADGLAYALSLARKHGLTYAQLKEKFSS